jgi:hypothetical protein
MSKTLEQFIEDPKLNVWAGKIRHLRQLGKTAKGFEKCDFYRQAGRLLHLTRKRIARFQEIEISSKDPTRQPIPLYPDWLQYIGFRQMDNNGNQQSNVLGQAYTYTRIYVYWSRLQKIRIRNHKTGEEDWLLNRPNEVISFLPIMQGKKISEIGRLTYYDWELVNPEPHTKPVPIKLNRKAIRITSNIDSLGKYFVLAVCNDGTIWKLDGLYEGDPYWKRFVEPPQD